MKYLHKSNILFTFVLSSKSKSNGETQEVITIQPYGITVKPQYMKNVAKESRQEGNKIFTSLLEEANKANERQAGKIVGKILAEAKENEEKAESETKETNKAGIPTGRYFLRVNYASRTSWSFVEYHPSGEEVWSEKPYSVNSFGMGIKRWCVYAHERAKRAFTVFVAETPEQVRFLSK